MVSLKSTSACVFINYSSVFLIFSIFWRMFCTASDGVLAPPMPAEPGCGPVPLFWGDDRSKATVFMPVVLLTGEPTAAVPVERRDCKAALAPGFRMEGEATGGAFDTLLLAVDDGG